jgi:hypothetical protein
LNERFAVSSNVGSWNAGSVWGIDGGRVILLGSIRSGGVVRRIHIVRIGRLIWLIGLVSNGKINTLRVPAGSYIHVRRISVGIVRLVHLVHCILIHLLVLLI